MAGLARTLHRRQASHRLTWVHELYLLLLSVHFWHKRYDKAAMRASVDALIEQKRYGAPLYGGRNVFGWEPGQPQAQTAISEE